MHDKDNHDNNAVKPRKRQTNFSEKSIAKRWPKGQSGNPHGRPPKPKVTSDPVDAFVNETMGVAVDGKKKEVPQLLAAFMVQRNRALEGDLQALSFLMKTLPALKKLLKEAGHSEEEIAKAMSSVTPMSVDEADKILMEAIKNDKLK